MDERMEATELFSADSGPMPEAVHAPEAASLSPAAEPGKQNKNNPQKPRRSAEERKRRRRIIRIVVILLVIGIIALKQYQKKHYKPNLEYDITRTDERKRQEEEGK